MLKACSEFGATDPTEPRIAEPNSFKPLESDNGKPFVFEFIPCSSDAGESTVKVQLETR